MSQMAVSLSGLVLLLVSVALMTSAVEMEGGDKVGSAAVTADTTEGPDCHMGMDKLDAASCNQDPQERINDAFEASSLMSRHSDQSDELRHQRTPEYSRFSLRRALLGLRQLQSGLPVIVHDEKKIPKWLKIKRIILSPKDELLTQGS